MIFHGVGMDFSGAKNLLNNTANEGNYMMKKNKTAASTVKLYQYFAILEISNKWRTNNFTFSKFTSAGLCVSGIVG